MARFRTVVERDVEGGALLSSYQRQGLASFLGALADRLSRLNFTIAQAFDGKTFAALPARPLCAFTRRTLALGQRFTFTRGTFASRSAGLNFRPLGYACAASSALPVPLVPLGDRNYPLDESICCRI